MSGLKDDRRFHVWNRCHACGTEPIVGQRFECLTCPAGPECDLCADCYGKFTLGAVVHPSPDSFSSIAGDGPHIFKSVDPPNSIEDCQPWLAVPFRPAAAPAVPDGFVVRPEFRLDSESFYGAYGAAIEPERGYRVIVTALHVMDELIRSAGIDCSLDNPAYTGEELPRIVRSVVLYDPYAAKWMLTRLGSASPMLVLPDSRLGRPEPCSQQDIAAFMMEPQATVACCRLAEQRPGVGEPIFLAVNSGKERPDRTIPAVVVESTEQTFVFRYERGAAIPIFSSGAPLINASGEVVGINIGRGRAGGVFLGHGNHVTSIRNHIRSGLQLFHRCDWVKPT